MTSDQPRYMPELTNRHYPYHVSAALILLTRIGVDPRRVDLLAVGEHERFKGEIHAQKPAPGESILDDTPIELQVRVPSAADLMPYQFFFGLVGGPDRGPEWDDRARELMAPFDAEVLRRLAATEYEELRYLASTSEPEHTARYLGLFGLDRTDDPVAWGALMPQYHQWAGNADMVARVLATLLGCHVTIRENIPDHFDIPADLQYHLGTASGELGQGTFLGTSFTECDSTYEVVLSDIPNERLKDFVPGGHTREKLEWALQECMPGNLKCRIRLVPARTESRLNHDEMPSILGVSSKL